MSRADAPKRFDCAHSDCYGMESCDDGDYIWFEDAEKIIKELEAEVKRLREAVNGLLDLADYVTGRTYCDISYDDFRAEIDSARDALKGKIGPA